MTAATRQERQVLFLYILTDAFLFFAALNLASLARLSTLYQIDIAPLQRDRLVCLAVFMVACMLAGSYKSTRIVDRFDAVYYTLIASAATGFVLISITGLLPVRMRAISRREIVLGVMLAGLLVPAWHYAGASLLARLRPLHRFFDVFGSENEARRIAAGIKDDPAATADARYVPLEECAREDPGRGGGMEVIITLAEKDSGQLMPLLEWCEKHYRRIFLHPSLYDTLLLPHTHLMAVAGIPLLEVGHNQVTPYLFVKRWIDCAIALIGLVLTLPVCIAAAAAIKLNSPGPVFYTQARMGQHGKEFKLYKFRSMVADAEAQTGPVWATDDDARITPVGRFIRKHRVDELPQLFNVLAGDMSIVGPRPERPHFHKEFCQKWPLFDRRLQVRPGVTSLSHVLGRYSSEPVDRLRYDLIYISSLSLFTDLKVIIATVRVVLGGKGAR